jgi:RND family efflux transporter MFP subunit
VLIAVALVVAYTMYLNRPVSLTHEPTVRVSQVEAARVEKQSLRIPVQAQGNVSAHTETQVVAEVTGRILEVSPVFHSGGYLRAGDVLARIDDRDYKAQLLRAKAEVARAKSALAQEKGMAGVALNEWQRLPDRNTRSQQANDLYLRKPQLAQAEAQLLSAQAEMHKAEDDLERTVIRAPYASIIREKLSELGQFVKPGSAVATIFAVDYAEIRLAMPHRKLK